MPESPVGGSDAPAPEVAATASDVVVEADPEVDTDPDPDPDTNPYAPIPTSAAAPAKKITESLPKRRVPATDRASQSADVQRTSGRRSARMPSAGRGLAPRTVTERGE